jgi:ACS family tartrate transporter-like MFS transporter
LALAYAAIGTAGLGLIFFLPLIVKSIGLTAPSAGLIVGAPAIMAAALLPLWGLWADRSGRWAAVGAAGCCALGLSLAAVLMPSAAALVAFSIALIGFYGFVAPFWTLPTAFLTGTGAAAGIAFINIAGNFGQFTGPALVGWMVDRYGSYSIGLACLALASLGGAALILMASRSPERSVAEDT